MMIIMNAAKEASPSAHPLGSARDAVVDAMQ